MVGRPGVGEELLLTGGRLYARGPDPRQFSARSVLDRLLSGPPGVAWEAPGRLGSVVGTGAGVIVGRRQDREGREQAVLDAYDASGERRWQARPGEGLDGESAVFPASVTTDRLLARVWTTPDTNAVDSYRLDDGERVWRREFDHAVRDLAVVDGTVLLATDSDGDGGSQGTVRALGTADGRERWRVGVAEPVATLAPVDGAVFALTESRLLLAIR